MPIEFWPAIIQNLLRVLHVCSLHLYFFVQNKPVHIPDVSKEKLPRAPLEFIRNIWGKSQFLLLKDIRIFLFLRILGVFVLFIIFHNITSSSYPAAEKVLIFNTGPYWDPP